MAILGGAVLPRLNIASVGPSPGTPVGNAPMAKPIQSPLTPQPQQQQPQGGGLANPFTGKPL
jgi:hypothetical protein